MPGNKKPLKKSIFLFILGFVTLLCIVLSFLTYSACTSSIYRAYDNRMTDILNYVYSHTDLEDLSECVETGVESDKYKELMAFMDSIMEDFDIHYLYIVKPVYTDEKKVVVNVLSADTAEGRKNDPDGYYLGLELEDVYEDKFIAVYADALEKDDFSGFRNFSSWGYDYTVSKPLINSKGEHFALLCVDIEVEDVQLSILTYTIINIILIVVLGIVFVILFLMWMNHNITEPIRALEQSVVSFAKRSHGQTDPAMLTYDDPHITTHNEVESLSNAVTQMSADMRDYAKNIIEAEVRVEDMKTVVHYMDVVAYQDALTHVKNKAWYDTVEDRINTDIENGTAQFGILMADLNNLKKINDTYGHEHGNDYIFGSCHQICVIFDHSPIFRIGGDEFVVLLENTDYEDREMLIAQLRTVFNMTAADEKRKPWERYSAAFGLAVFNREVDRTMNDVFKRADELMYKDKMESKMARE